MDKKTTEILSNLPSSHCLMAKQLLNQGIMLLITAIGCLIELPEVLEKCSWPKRYKYLQQEQDGCIRNRMTDIIFIPMNYELKT